MSTKSVKAKDKEKTPRMGDFYTDRLKNGRVHFFGKHAPKRRYTRDETSEADAVAVKNTSR